MGIATGHGTEGRCRLVVNVSGAPISPAASMGGGGTRNGLPFFLSFCAHASCNVFRPPVRLLVAPSFIVVKSPFVEHCVTELQLRVRFVCRQRHGGGTPFSSPPSFAGFSPGPAAVVLEPPPLPPFPSRSLRLPRREAREREGAD